MTTTVVTRVSTVRLGSLIASEFSEKRNVLSPCRGNPKNRIRLRTTNTPNAMGAFQERISAFSRTIGEESGMTGAAVLTWPPPPS